METWFTSDTHFSHIPEFLWGPRGFSNEREMNEAIVDRWNNVVRPGDIVYHLGDMALTDVENAMTYIRQLNGKIYWIYGNHDTKKKIALISDECPNVWELGWAYCEKFGKHSIYMGHYPTLTANFDEKHFTRHVIALHGHTHQQKNWLNPENPFMYHVGMDSHNCTPVHIDEVITDIRNRWNELGCLPASVQPRDTYPYGGFINGN